MALEHSTDVVRDHVTVTVVEPAAFLALRRVAVLCGLFAIVCAVVVYASAVERPGRAVFALAAVVGFVTKLAFPAPRRRVLAERVRVSSGGVTCAGETLIAGADIARATAMAGALYIEHRERGRSVTLAPTASKDVDAMLAALGPSRVWKVRVERKAGIDALSSWWRLGQIVCVVIGVVFAAMESLHGWGFVVLFLGAIAAVFWHREMRWLDLTIDARGLRFDGPGTKRAIAASEIAGVSRELLRVDLELVNGTKIPLILAEDDNAARDALVARIAELEE